MAKDLTSVTLAALTKKPPEGGRRETPDGKIRGLYFVQQSTGAASWAFRYRGAGRSRKLTIGSYPKIDLKSARDLASEAAVSVAKGGDPAADKRTGRIRARIPADRELIEKVVPAFIERYAKKNTRESSWYETERLLNREIVDAWKGRPLSTITRAEVHDLLDGIVDRGSPITANRTLAALRRLCNWAVERGIIDDSPCEKVKAPAAERSRDRVLSNDELRLAWQACDAIDWPFGPLVKLLLLTGQRRDEVAEMRWSEIDLQARTWTIPRERVKNDQAHVVPLSDVAVTIFKVLPKIKGTHGFVFTTSGETAVSGFARAKERIDAAMLAAIRKDAAEPDKVEIPRWTLHDLRRSAASGMAGLGIAVHVVEAVLNHRSGTIKGVAAVYNRYSYDAEKRAALDAWARFVEKLVIGNSNENVVVFGRRADV